MKKQQIEFDFSKWGQEGISVEYWKDKPIKTLHQNPTNEDVYYGVNHKGDIFVYNKDCFSMYQEIKPREIWVNQQCEVLNSFSYKTELEAKNAACDYRVKQIKFREVLDDEQ